MYRELRVPKCVTNTFFTAFALLMAGIVLESGALAQTLITTPPPDSVELRLPRSQNPPSVKTFLSKRGPDELKSTYGAAGIKLHNVDNGRATEFSMQSDIIVSYQESLDVLIKKGGDVTNADDVRVVISWKDRGGEPCNGEYLGGLANLLLVDKSRKSEFDAICKRYGYIDNAYFQQVPDPKNPSTLIGADAMIKDKWSKATPTPKPTEAELNQLMMTSDPQKASAAMNRYKTMVDASGKPQSVQDVWNVHLSHIKELDQYAYRTAVAIPVDPRSK